MEEASHTIRVSRLWSKFLLCYFRDELYDVFKCCIVFWFPINWLFFFCIFLKVDVMLLLFAKIGVYLVRWCMEPIKLFNCLNVFGGDSFQSHLFFLLMF